jgi:hypothetical protein
VFGGGFDLTANSILVDTAKNGKDWYGAIKNYIQNPEIVKTLQDNLHETVKILTQLITLLSNEENYI